MKDNHGVTVTWSSTSAGANRPQNTRPMAIFPAKESVELLKEFIPLLENEVKQLDSGVKVLVGGHKTVAGCDNCSMSMQDGKMVTNLLNCGGAYCTMCVKSQEQCQRWRLYRMDS